MPRAKTTNNTENRSGLRRLRLNVIDVRAITYSSFVEPEHNALITKQVTAFLRDPISNRGHAHTLSSFHAGLSALWGDTSTVFKEIGAPVLRKVWTLGASPTPNGAD
jgi:hypothetical protein